MITPSFLQGQGHTTKTQNKTQTMESCVAVEKELDRVMSKFTGLKDHSDRTLEELITSFQNVQKELSEGKSEDGLTATQSLILTQMLRRIKEAVTRMGQEHKDLHSSVSKVGKTIDRNFATDFSVISQDCNFEETDKKLLLNEVISEHFMRQGMLDIADELIQDANLEIADDKKVPFLELHRILGALKHRNLEPALSWCEQNRQKLNDINSSLEFKLHRLKFVDLLKRGTSHQLEALHYSRNFAPFAHRYARDVQVLMGSMLYLRQGIENSPYSHLLTPIYWEEICDIFTRDACTLLGMSVESPLSVSIRAGCLALPPLLNIRQVMQQRQVTGVWSNKEELPVEIDLGREYRYHSIFACPILRQQSTDINPPMRLICGHVISRDALTKLSNGNKVKCPYCPIEQLPSEAKQVFF